MTAAKLLVADEYRFSHIKFGRDLYKFFADEHANIAHIVSILGVVVYWGYDAFEISQRRLGQLLVEVCAVPTAPPNKTISKYLHRLADLGYLQIPVKRSRNIKQYVFTNNFKDLLDPIKRQNMWDKRIHPPKNPNALGSILLQKTEEKENRASQKIVSLEPPKVVSRPQRAPLVDTKKQDTKQPINRPRPARTRHSTVKLSKFEKSVRWWLFGFEGIKSESEAEILTGRFLALNAAGSDEIINQMRSSWNKEGGRGDVMTDAERSYAIRRLVEHLRAVDASDTVGHLNVDNGQNVAPAPPPPEPEILNLEPIPASEIRAVIEQLESKMGVCSNTDPIVPPPTPYPEVDNTDPEIQKLIEARDKARSRIVW